MTGIYFLNAMLVCRVKKSNVYILKGSIFDYICSTLKNKIICHF
ncbi:hypothetical protein D778_02034 [Xanthomarina gelatinilytica]|uniref:Uncharacterized protein n=1 Tax=Xanthomarina gelatinilytica TaxID=1137281 RepID=M7N323_9FLAO|nr:hypothetical protein D778_02034 [Xanthomarina gelatinilytica]